jgi:molecular chaperone GrpE (heat shock protein)
MEVEPPSDEPLPPSDDDALAGEREVEAQLEVTPETEESFEEPKLDEEDEAPVRAGQKRAWPEMSTQRVKRCRREVDQIREVFEDEQDTMDPTMVSEYADDIFKYMEDLEVCDWFVFAAPRTLLTMSPYRWM